jgi:hypothetical protein
MIRKLSASSAAVIVAATLFTLFDAGVSGAMPAQAATGTVTCQIHGKGKFSPKLTLAGVATTAVKIKFHGVSGNSMGLPGCSAVASVTNTAGTTTPVTITNVKVKGSGFIQPTSAGNANACSVFTSSDSVGVVKVKFIWTSSPPIAPTTLTFTGGTAPIVSGSPMDTITFPAPAGTTTTGTGSFTPPVTPLVSLATNIVSTCGPGWGPYPSFTFGTGSTISLP